MDIPYTQFIYYFETQKPISILKSINIYLELFLNSEKEDYGPGYASGQIRIAYLAGNANDNKKLKGGLILGFRPAARNYALKTIEDYQGTWTDKYHNFSILWKPGISLKQQK